jgi:4-amino-4-deoxy-L-arabinose transferase-like glycosyltransferase
LTAAPFLAWEKRLALLWDRRVWLGALSLALTALPWYVWVTVETRGAFFRGFFWDHNFSRFLSPLNDHTGSPLYYFVVLLVGIAPWSVYLVCGSWYGWWSMVRVPWSWCAGCWRRAAEVAASDRAGTTEKAVGAGRVAAYRFLGAWLACNLVFFSAAATKLPNYLLHAAMPFALLIARFLQRWRLGQLDLPHWVMPTCLTCLAGIGVATGLGLVFVSGRLPVQTIAHRAGPSVAGLEYWALFGLVPVAAAVAGLWSMRSGRRDGVLVSMALGIILFLAPLAAWALPSWNLLKAPRPLVEETGAARRRLDIRIGDYQLEHLPSLNFYTRRSVVHHADQAEALAFLRYPVPVYLFMPAAAWDSMKGQASADCRSIAVHPDLYRASNVVVVTNAPYLEAEP